MIFFSFVLCFFAGHYLNLCSLNIQNHTKNDSHYCIQLLKKHTFLKNSPPCAHKIMINDWKNFYKYQLLFFSDQTDDDEFCLKNNTFFFPIPIIKIIRLMKEENCIIFKNILEKLLTMIALDSKKNNLSFFDWNSWKKNLIHYHSTIYPKDPRQKLKRMDLRQKEFEIFLKSLAQFNQLANDLAFVKSLALIERESSPENILSPNNDNDFLFKSFKNFYKFTIQEILDSKKINPNHIHFNRYKNKNFAIISSAFVLENAIGLFYNRLTQKYEVYCHQNLFEKCDLWKEQSPFLSDIFSNILDHQLAIAHCLNQFFSEKTSKHFLLNETKKIQFKAKKLLNLKKKFFSESGKNDPLFQLNITFKITATLDLFFDIIDSIFEMSQHNQLFHLKKVDDLSPQKNA